MHIKDFSVSLERRQQLCYHDNTHAVFSTVAGCAMLESAFVAGRGMVRWCQVTESHCQRCPAAVRSGQVLWGSCLRIITASNSDDYSTGVAHNTIACLSIYSPPKGLVSSTGRYELRYSTLYPEWGSAPQGWGEQHRSTCVYKERNRKSEQYECSTPGRPVLIHFLGAPC